MPGGSSQGRVRDYTAHTCCPEGDEEGVAARADRGDKDRLFPAQTLPQHKSVLCSNRDNQARAQPEAAQEWKKGHKQNRRVPPALNSAGA